MKQSPGNVEPVELLLRGAGVAVGAWAAVVIAIVGSLITPLRWGTMLVPLAVVIGVVGNAALVWFTYRVTESRLLALIPGAIWLILTFIASGQTREGDLILYQGNWVAIVYLLAGSVTIGITAYRLPPPGPPGSAGDPSSVV